MIYTIGHTESYEKGFEEFKESLNDYKKKGKTDDYEGGSVWKTRKEAYQYMLNNNVHGYSVYGVEADWEIDTEENEHGEFRNLLRDSVLHRLKYVAYGMYEGDGLSEPISIVKTDGMAISRVYEEDGYLVISHIDDKDDLGTNKQIIKIHPADFVDFYEVINEAARLFHKRKCHWQDSLCRKKFMCLSCDSNI